MRLALAIVLTIPAVLCGVLLMLLSYRDHAEYSVVHGRDYGDRHRGGELDSAGHLCRALPPRRQMRCWRLRGKAPPAGFAPF